MEISGPGKSPNTSLSFRYNANNEELEELFNAAEDEPLTAQNDPPSTTHSENASPKRGDKTPSILDKYFKSIRNEKPVEKEKEKEKGEEVKDKPVEEPRSSTPKEISSSPMKEYLNRLGKRSTSEVNTEVKEGSNETWKLFHDFKFKIAQAVEDMKTRSLEETKEKSVPRENSMSDSEENSAVKDVDQHSVGDTDNQVSSLDSSIQNLSEITQPVTAKVIERDLSLPVEKNHSDSSDDTHKNLVYSEMADVREYDSLVEVESGVEAMEDTLDGFGDVSNVLVNPDIAIVETEKPVGTPELPRTPSPVDFSLPPSKTNFPSKKAEPTKKSNILNFKMYFLTFCLILSYILFPNSNLWNGFLLGIWSFSLIGNVKDWLLGTYFSDEPYRSGIFQPKKQSSSVASSFTIPVVKEHQPLKKYEGWINHYRFPDYDPYTYHINKTTTSFMKLEGCNLRISYTRTKVAKRALWDEKIDKVTFYQHRLYNLTGARVILLPKGLVKRRQWSKKYPICIVLSERERIQVIERENAAHAERKMSDVNDKKKEPHNEKESESTETNTSPEKKKKFVWRRREKSISHTEGEPGKEGLRHRLVRKMHRDKKTDSVSTSTEPAADTQSPNDKTAFEDSIADDVELTKSNISNKEEIEDDFDDDMSRIKDLIEEAENESEADGPADGEWSVHVRTSTDSHSHLYLFARTGRDKHEWFRRLSTAVSEANAACAEIQTEDKSPTDSETKPETKDGIEMAVYKVTDKESVAFAKNSNKNLDSTSEGVTITSLSHSLPQDANSYEKNFWPFLLKIIQNKSSPSECSCRTLPAEVTWVNTSLARLFYDLMRDPVMIAKVQNRIQRKLNTLKLPSFMSPLVITELSLAGACPLVERVCPVSWDSCGVWLDADLRYDGGAYIALLTQINLLKLKEKNLTLEEQLLETSTQQVDNELDGSPTSGIFSERQMRTRKPAIYDSEVEDSAESSSDDESPPCHPDDSSVNIPLSETSSSTGEVSSKKKFLRMVDKIATNKYFQQVIDYKYIKRAMEGLSNTDIKLHLEVHGLEGRLAINMPPPPHDRVWVGFRTNPQLILKARPAVGARTLRFAHISNWIEQKLSKEFEKVLVLPNMEDFIIDIMTPTPVNFE